jgi:anti-sigma B factor antagonist
MDDERSTALGQLAGSPDGPIDLRDETPDVRYRVTELAGEGATPAGGAGPRDIVAGAQSGGEQGGRDLGGLVEVTVEHLGDVAVLHASGEIDISTAPVLREHLDAVTSETPRVIVDLGGVTFLDSTGLGVLIATRKRREAELGDGGVDLVVNAPQILKVLEVTGLMTLFPIYESLAEALP